MMEKSKIKEVKRVYYAKSKIKHPADKLHFFPGIMEKLSKKQRSYR